MRIRRHLEPHDARYIDIDDHALDLENVHVASEGIFPCLKVGMSDSGTHEIHLADTPGVMLKRRDLLRIRRPQEHRTIALRPTGIVGGVTKILHAILGQLCLLTGGGISYPKVVVADERG